VEVFWANERCVPPADPESNYGIARDALLAKVGVPDERVHRINGELSDIEEAARQYEQEIARVFSASTEGPAPVLDLILLGMGVDGHTASLFPYSRALPVRGRWVVANYRPGLRPHRITLTAPILNRARQVRLLVTGSDRAARLREVLEAPPDPERLPVQLVNPVTACLVWMVDRAAAARLAGSQ
jgi:6-phosphogluconolactonase